MTVLIGVSLSIMHDHLKRNSCSREGEGEALTARKKSLISWVIYTANPIYVKWNR